MMKFCLTVLMLTAGLWLAAAEKPFAVREVKVNAGKDLRPDRQYTTALSFVIPDNCKGVKLIDNAGKDRALTILRTQGSLWDVYFNATAGEKLRLEFFDQSVTAKSAAAVSGLIQEARSFDGRTIDSIEQFRNLWDKSPRTGAGFTGRVYSGVNPYGRNLNSLNRYHGFIHIDKAGEYTFYTASTDASFLLIDGKMVTSWPGRHWVGGGLYGEFSGSINLTAGDHPFEYLHANNQDSYYAIAAWQPPDHNKFEAIPASAFTPALTAEDGKLTAMDGKALPDFSWELKTVLDVYNIQMYQVEIFAPDKVKKWNWGDGTSEDKPATVHYYFKPGIYTVTLETADGTAERKIEVAPRNDQKFVDNKDAAKMVEEAVKQEKSIGIQPEGYRFLAEAMVCFKLQSQGRDFYRTMIAKQKIVPPEVIFIFFKNLILDELILKENYEATELELKRMIGELQKPEELAAAKLEYTSLLLNGLNRPDEAFTVLAGVRRDNVPKASQRDYDWAKADLTLIREGCPAAMALYNNMESLTKKMSRSQILQSSSVVINIRNCLVTKKYQDAMDYIEQLENSQPEMRMNPEMMILKAKVLKELERPRAAAICFERVLRLNPPDKLMIEANLELGQYFYDRQEFSRAGEYLLKVKTEAPRSREAVQADKLLKKISR